MAGWDLYLMSFLYVLAGIFHFIKPKLYKSIIPPYLPSKDLLVIGSGIAEVILGIGLLMSDTKIMSLWGIIVMLILFLPVHIYMLSEKKFSAKFPRWLLLLRIPMQFALIYWSYSHLK